MAPFSSVQEHNLSITALIVKMCCCQHCFKFKMSTFIDY